MGFAFISPFCCSGTERAGRTVAWPCTRARRISRCWGRSQAGTTRPRCPPSPGSAAKSRDLPTVSSRPAPSPWRTHSRSGPRISAGRLISKGIFPKLFYPRHSPNFSRGRASLPPLPRSPVHATKCNFGI